MRGLASNANKMHGQRFIELAGVVPDKAGFQEPFAVDRSFEIDLMKQPFKGWGSLLLNRPIQQPTL